MIRIFVLLVIVSLRLFAETPFESGYESYTKGEWLSAQSYFEIAKSETPYDDAVFLYLSIVYQKRELFALAEKAMIEGINLNGENTREIAFNLGNFYFEMGNLERAADAYGVSVQGAAPLPEGFLNRANLYTTLGEHEKAIEDYTRYLSFRPFDSRREVIEEMIYRISVSKANGKKTEAPEDNRGLPGEGNSRESNKNTLTNEEIVSSEVLE